jgi:hypothetical protein
LLPLDKLKQLLLKNWNFHSKISPTWL